MTTPKQQCEELLKVVLPFAEQQLGECGALYPFGATMNSRGAVALVSSYDGTEQPGSVYLSELLLDGFQQGGREGRYIATCLAYDVKVVPPGTREKIDAVAVELDHRDNYSVVAYFPYTIDAGAVTFESSFARAGEYKVFGRHDA